MIENRDVKKDLEQLDSILKDKGISRRDAIKMMGLGGAAMMVGGTTQAEAATSLHASSAKGRIVIVGGGLAGMSTAARLTNSLSNPDITVLEPEATSVSYQPGQTLVGAGLWDKSDITYNRDEYLPTGVKLIKENAVEFHPKENYVVTSGGTKVEYDALVIAAGLKLDYGRIKGLEEAGEVYSSGDTSKLVKILQSKGASSIYTADTAVQCAKDIDGFIAKAKSGKKVKGVFTHPNTPIKCGGAPKKIMSITQSKLVDAGKDARANADLHFYPNGGGMFGIKAYHEAIVKQFEARDMKWSYKHNLVEVKDNGVAVFNHHWKEKGAWDEDLEEYTMVTKNKLVEVPFDFIHITPPMKAPDEVGKSDLGSQKGFIPVKKEINKKGTWTGSSLQHLKFDNVFALGDIVGTPMGKTGGSARKQYKVVTDNLIAYLEGKKLEARYDGYTVCPLITEIGKVMLAEFNWASKPLGSGENAASAPLDPNQERYIWWLMKIYLLKPMTIMGMLSGRA
jgi:sulfide:quinone oxidoreductase